MPATLPLTVQKANIRRCHLSDNWTSQLSVEPQMSRKDLGKSGYTDGLEKKVKQALMFCGVQFFELLKVL